MKIFGRRTYKIFKQQKTKVLGISIGLVLLSGALAYPVYSFFKASIAMAESEVISSAPVISKTAPAEGAVIYKSNGAYTISAVVTDENNDVDSVKWKLTGPHNTDSDAQSFESTFDRDGDTWSGTYNVGGPGLKEGSYQLRFTAKDSAGNNATPKIVNFSVAQVAPVPELLNVSSYFVKEKYKGISTDFSVKNITNATDLEIRVDRTNNEPVIKKAKQKILDLINSGSPVTLTAPIVIQTGSYNEAGSSSWNLPLGSPWTNTTEPTAVVLTITFGNGQTMTRTNTLGQIGSSKATLTEVMPVDTIKPIMSNYTLSSYKLRASGINPTVTGVTEDDTSVSNVNYAIFKYVNGKRTSVRSWKNLPASDGTSYGSKLVRTNSVIDGLKDLPDGVYEFSVRGHDAAGNKTNGGDFIFYIDNKKPTVTISSPIDSSFISGSLHVSGTASDDETYIEKINYTVDEIGEIGGTWKANGPSGTAVGKENWSFMIDSLSDGIYRIKIQALDAAGNSKYSYLDVTIDSTNPAIKKNIFDPGVVKNTAKPVLIADVDGTGSNVASTQYRVLDKNGQKISGFNWVDMDPSDGQFDSDIESITADVIITDLEDGEYIVRIRAFDSAGNKKSGVDTRLIIDNSAPKVKITAPAADSSNKGAVEIRGSVTDYNLRHYYINIEKHNEDKWKSIYSNTVLSDSFEDKLLHTLPDDANGTYRVTLAARDKADGGSRTGNRSEDIIRIFKVDNEGPKVNSIVINGQNVDNEHLGNGNCQAIKHAYNIAGQVSLSAMIIDDLSGVKNSEFRIRKVNSKGCTQTNIYKSEAAKLIKNENNDWQGTLGSAIDPSVMELNGLYTIMVTSKDNAGNAATAYVYVNIDNEAPDAPEIDDIEDNSSTERTISGTAEPNSTVDVSVTDSNDSTQTKTTQANEDGIWSIDFSELVLGSHIVSASSTDAFNNKSRAAIKQFEVKPLADSEAERSVSNVAGVNTGNKKQANSGQQSASSLNNASNSNAAPVGQERSTNGRRSNPNDYTGVSQTTTNTDQNEANDKKTDKKVAGLNTFADDFGKSGKALAAVDVNKGCDKVLSLCWYYWPPIIVGVLTFGYIGYRRLANENEQI